MSVLMNKYKTCKPIFLQILFFCNSTLAPHFLSHTAVRKTLEGLDVNSYLNFLVTFCFKTSGSAIVLPSMMFSVMRTGINQQTRG